jgi:hypothetical protein
MRVDVENASSADLLRLRDKLGHILAKLPLRRQFYPFVGVWARRADLEAFAVEQWGVRNEPEAEELRTAPEPASDAQAAAMPSPEPMQQQATAGGVAESVGASARREPAPVADTVKASRQKRIHPPKAEIDEAVRNAPYPHDLNSVFGELQKMAGQRYGLLIGFVDGEGIKYQSETGVKFLTKKNLADRLRRERKLAEGG